jgi:hypothetical protein
MALDWKNPDYAPVFAERAERLLRLRENPSLIPSIRAYYAEHPADFINDWIMTYDPRQAGKNKKTTIPFVLFDRQRGFIDWIVERWKSSEPGLVDKSRDMGVSWLCCAFAVWMWVFVPGTMIGFGSRKEIYVDEIGDPKSLFWKLRFAIRYLPREFAPVGYDEKKHAPFMKVINPENGSVITGEAGNNIGRGNRATIYFVDESAFLENQESVDAALSMTTDCRIDLSTGNGSGNLFYRKLHGGKIPVFVFDWKDDPRKDQEWYEDQCRKLDPIVVAQEIDRNHEAAVTNAFIPDNVVKAAMARSMKDAVMEGPIMIGVDVARFGDDKSVITIRRGRTLIRQIVLSKYSVPELAGKVREEANAYARNFTIGQIAVDADGVGGGVADLLREWFRCVRDVNSAKRMKNGRDYNLRAFMWREMREWLETATLPNDNDLKSELTSIRYGYRGGELLLESKDDAKARGVHSPDRADSLALTFAYPASNSTKMIHKIPIIQADLSAGY